MVIFGLVKRNAMTVIMITPIHVQIAVNFRPVAMVIFGLAKRNVMGQTTSFKARISARILVN